MHEAMKKGWEREVTRNKALLLWMELRDNSPEIAKIAAFEGAFDRLGGPSTPRQGPQHCAGGPS